MEDIPTEDIKILYRRRLERKQPVDDFLNRWPALAEEGKATPEPKTPTQPEPLLEKKEVKKDGKKSKG